MKVCIILSIIVGALAVPSFRNPAQNTQTTTIPIDDHLLRTFAIILIEQKNYPSEVMRAVSQLFLQERYTPEERNLLLALAGIDFEFSKVILNNILPLLQAEKRTKDEIITALIFITQKLCTEGKDFKRHCSPEAMPVLDLIMMRNRRGCDGSVMTDFTNTRVTNETCVCNDQQNPVFWANLFEIYNLKAANKTTKSASLMLAMAIETPCNGHLNATNRACYCSKVTKGHDSTLLQYILTSEDIQKNLSSSQKRTLQQQFSPAPSFRILGLSSSLSDYLIKEFAKQSQVSPQILSLLQNQGDFDLKQLLLASVGLDTSLTQIVLNGGFGNSPDKIPLINYLASTGQFDPSIIPALTGVSNGQQFFINNLIESGQIDPVTAVLLSSISSGGSTSDIFDTIISINTQAQNNPDYYRTIGRPYIPSLPVGIFPGSKLYFPQFEALGINTCALHDFRNRFECGYLGITASACEVQPYCCYNPVFITDSEVQRVTNNAITSAVALPWCYYNIFFIYYDTFYLPVQRPGGFASPLQCSRLFKYGLELDPSLYSLIEATNSNALSGLVNQRTDCGFPGITEFHCVAVRGCCWDTSTAYKVDQCYGTSKAPLLNLGYESIPAAFRPANGSCDTNHYKLEQLYYQRVACMYTLEFFDFGIDYAVKPPNRFDCLSVLGCCWESDDVISQKYPYMPRCYQRVGGALTPANVPNVATLLNFRSGGSNVNGLPKVITDILPPAPTSGVGSQG